MKMKSRDSLPIPFWSGLTRRYQSTGNYGVRSRRGLFPAVQPLQDKCFGRHCATGRLECTTREKACQVGYFPSKLCGSSSTTS